MLEAMTSFHFLRPWWLIALLPLIILVYLWVRKTRQQSAWSAAISQPLLEVLLDSSVASTAKRLRTAMWLAALIAILGLAGPAWQKLPQPVEKKSDALVIVMDLSLSMFAQDVTPSRLAKARQKIVDVLRMRQEGSTGLVAYAGDGHAVVPITDDRHTIENLLSALSPAMMPVLGSRPATGLALARELFRNAGLFEGRILLITDGIKRASEVSDFRDAAFPISIIGIGSRDGAPIPINRRGEPTRYLTDDLGREIRPGLEESALIQAAQQSYGRYSTLTISDRDLEIALSTPLPTEDASIEVDREFDIWADMGFWLCLPLALMMLASFQRGLFVALTFAVMLPEPAFAQVSTPSSSANSVGEAAETVSNPFTTVLNNLWQRRDQQAYEAMVEGDAVTAAQLFADQQWRGSARYRSGDFSGAAGDFAQDPSPTGLYNQGNALARLGRYQEAISQYDQVLADDPNQEDATFNKALLEQLLEQQQQQEQAEQQQQDKQQQQSQRPQGGETEEEQPSEDDGPPQEPEQKPEESEDSSESENAEETSEEDGSADRDEKQEALEQWLRRVPDDPGGLLRRKFQHETKQRLRDGDYSNREDDQVW
jgi:Ca-activated chloride channel family protein